MLGIFQKGNKVFDKTFASLGTTIKLTNETIDCETRKFRLVTLQAINKKWKGFRVPTAASEDKIKQILRIFPHSKNHWFSRHCNGITNVSFGTKTLKLRCVCVKPRRMWKETPNKTYISIMTIIYHQHQMQSWTLWNLTVNSLIGG